MLNLNINFWKFKISTLKFHSIVEIINLIDSGFLVDLDVLGVCCKPLVLMIFYVYHLYQIWYLKSDSFWIKIIFIFKFDLYDFAENFISVQC